MVLHFEIERESWRVDQQPNSCPLCHHAIEPKFLVGHVVDAPATGRAAIELVFVCPRRDCNRAFLGRYVGHYDRDVRLVGVAPYTAEPPRHPAMVTALSPQFVEIFAQASAAESWGLGEIAGCGYRKSLEFLVKDYCIATEPDRAPDIRRKQLGPVLAEHVSDPGIKECARRASWLGNDETHYERRWNDKDIGDLKALIALTVNWIEAHLLTKKYLDSMPG